MNIKFYILAAAIFYCCTLAAQVPTRTYQWQWAVTGGSVDKIISYEELGSIWTVNNNESVNDIAVDKNNNIYFTSHIANNAQFMGHTIPGHNDNANYWNPDEVYSDILIASLDCAGNYRWHYTIGGRNDDIVTDIETDTLGGVYVSIQISGKNPIIGDSIYFNNDTVYTLDKNQPTVTNGYIALVKLDTLGNLQWIRWACGPQGTGWYMFPQGLQVEPNGTVHWAQQIIKAGVYADGQMILTDSLLQKNNLAIMKYDRNGNFLGYTMLAAKNAGSTHFTAAGKSCNKLQFRYNQITKQYYINVYNGFSYVIIGNDSIPQGALAPQYCCGIIAAFDSVGNYQWHRKSYSNPIPAFDIDDKSNIFISVVCTNFANIIYNNGQHEWDVNYFTIKISSDGTVDTVNYKIIDTKKHVFLKIKVNQDEVALQGMDNVSLDMLTKRDWILLRLDPNNLAGDAKDSVVWSSGSAGGSTQAQNANPMITTDNQGNYILGGAVGTSFQLSPTVSISNSGWKSLSDFWIGKYAKYECGEQVDNAVENVFIPKNNELLIYPNQVKDELRIGNNLPFDYLQFTIYNLTGKQIVNGRWLNGQSINVSVLPAGIYILKIGEMRGKFIKE